MTHEQQVCYFFKLSVISQIRDVITTIGQTGSGFTNRT